MPQFPWLDPLPFFFPAGKTGCLLIHGFTGSPPEMRPLGEYLAQRDITVSGPLLAGHGTRPQDMAGVTWEDWYGSVETAYRDLRGCCDRVAVAGFSLGAVLALHLAAQQEVSALITLSPALQLKDWRSTLLPLLRLFLKQIAKPADPTVNDLTDPQAYKRFWSYDSYPVAGAYQLWRAQRAVRPELGRIRCPTLVIYSSGDTVIGAGSGPLIYGGVAATDKDMLVLHNSGHGIVVDSECQVVFERTYAWIVGH
jgi:carboxylesterase